MDAVKFFEEKKGMCDTFRNCCDCPMSESNTHDELDCTDFEEAYPEKAVAVVEQWSKEHPVITNRQKMIEVFGINGLDSADVRPSWLDAEYKEPKGE